MRGWRDLDGQAANPGSVLGSRRIPQRCRTGTPARVIVDHAASALTCGNRGRGHVLVTSDRAHRWSSLRVDEGGRGERLGVGSHVSRTAPSWLASADTRRHGE